mgnify:CR=1 FL=1
MWAVKHFSHNCGNMFNMEDKFKDRLKELRQDKHIGQKALAKILNISHGAISFWENGQREPTMSSLIALADYFDVSIDYLVGRKND